MARTIHWLMYEVMLTNIAWLHLKNSDEHPRRAKLSIILMAISKITVLKILRFVSRLLGIENDIVKTKNSNTLEKRTLQFPVLVVAVRVLKNMTKATGRANM